MPDDRAPVKTIPLACADDDDRAGLELDDHPPESTGRTPCEPQSARAAAA